MKKILIKDTIIEIKNTKKRFISILLILLLGSAIFVGINSVCPDMKITADEYYNTQNLMDFKLLSTYGITKSDIDKLLKMEDIKGLMSSYSFDSIINVDNDKSVVTKINTVPLDSIKTNNESYINRLKIIQGRMIENNNECVVEEGFLENYKLKIGDKIKIETEKDFEDKLKNNEFTIVGTAISPYYMSIDKGSSKLGEGKVNSYMYIAEDVIDSDIYTEVFLTINRNMQDNTYYSNYNKKAMQVQESLEKLAEVQKDERYNEIVNEATEKINEAKVKLSSEVKKAEDEISTGENEIGNAKIEIENGENKIIANQNKINREFENAKAELEKAENILKSKENEFVKIKEESNKQFDLANKTISELNTKKDENISNKNKNIGKIANLNNSIDTQNIELEKLKLELISASDLEKPVIQNKIDKLIEEINNLIGSVANLTQANYIIDETIKAYNENINKITTELNKNKENLKKGENELILAREELNKNKNNYEKQKKLANSEIANARVTLQNGKNEIIRNEEKLNEARQELETKTKEAEDEILKAEDELATIKTPKYYVLGRDKLQSYVEYEQDADRIASLAIIFPAVFFLVAALVSLTSMTRMVEEQRLQIGTLKGLGYNKTAIASKYLWYSTLAAITGSVIGIMIGFYFIPKIVFEVYEILYVMPPPIIELNMIYATTAIGISIFCTTIATLMACIKELKSTPAMLMRPKAPKVGKKVFIEKINFIWSRLKFTQKVTARNIFRYKKRLFMTILGVAGCTSLLLAAFGLKDSVMSISSFQYNKVYNYDLQMAVKDKLEYKEVEDLQEFLNSKTEIIDYIFSRSETIKCSNEKFTKDVQLITLKDDDDISKYINLKSRTTDETYKLQDDTVVITEQLAKQLDLKIGDEIDLKFNIDDEPVNVKISGIVENYVYHYIYMTESLYNRLFDKIIDYNNIYANLRDDKISDLGFVATLLKNENLNNVNLTSEISGIFENSMSSLNYVVLVLIISAGLLALIVLYNLANINISERQRELATIKVLGFYDKEVTSYVNKEGIILTFIGIGLGLIFGQILNYFIIITCETDIAMLGRIINPVSYILATAITLCFSIFVNILTHFALKKIDMIESLKSVE